MCHSGKMGIWLTWIGIVRLLTGGLESKSLSRRFDQILGHVYCHLSFSDSVRFDQGSAITMMMSILLVLVQFPGCWAANCSSRPWVGKTATMKYNSELFSLRDIMSWWCLLKFYIQLHILFWHSHILQQKAVCGIVSKFKLMLSTLCVPKSGWGWDIH